MTAEVIGDGRGSTDALVARLYVEGEEFRKVVFYMSDKDFKATAPKTDLEVELLWDRAVDGMLERLLSEITVDRLEQLDNPVECSSDLAAARLDHPSGVRVPGAVLAAFEI